MVLLAHELGDTLDQPRLVDLIRNGGHDDRRSIALLADLDFGLRPHQHGAAAGELGLSDTRLADDVGAGGKVGPGHQLEQLAQPLGGGRRRGGLRRLDRPDHRRDDFAEVVRRDVGRHADGDAGRSVDEQVGVGRRQYDRFLSGLVVVGNEVDRLLVEVGHHLVGERVEACLGVAHRRRRVAVDRAEVALAVGQHIAHVEVLRHANERVVDRRVAVGMVVAHHLADDLGALAVTARGRQPHGFHAVEHAAVRRFQPVADVGQRASNDYAHRVIHVRALHLVFDVDGNAVLGRRAHRSVRCRSR